MTIEIHKPELEALIRQRLNSGNFRDIDELLTQALEAFGTDAHAGTESIPRKRLIDVLTSAPFAGSELQIERQ